MAAGDGLPWPARAQTETNSRDLVLTAAATRRHPGVHWWWNQRKIGKTHGAYCYLCDRHVATWARKWPITDKAVEEVMRHRGLHLAQKKGPEALPPPAQTGSVDPDPTSLSLEDTTSGETRG